MIQKKVGVKSRWQTRAVMAANTLGVSAVLVGPAWAYAASAMPAASAAALHPSIHSNAATSTDNPNPGIVGWQ